jgi:hypothetical protein
MVDGEMSVMMMAMISSNTPSRQGARTEFLVPNGGFWWWRRNGTLSRKNAEPPGMEGGVEAMAEAATPPPGAVWPDPRHQVV